MSKETKNLKLFKYDKDTDDFNITTFNINQALNNNWDKVDSEFKRLEESIPEAPVKSVNGKDGNVVLTTEDIKCKNGQSIESSLSDMATKTEVKAAQSRADSAYSLANSKQDKFTISSSTTSTSTTQVANSYAVKEAMDKANSAYDKSEQAFQLGDSTRKDVVSILSSKKLEGLTINSSWEQIKNALQNMSLGKKWANGTQYIDGSKGSFYVSALAFQPSFIIVLVSGSTYSKSVAYAFGQKVGGDEISSVYMLPDGFSVSTSKRYYFNDDNIQWIAFE